jgi:hypothetical protein
MQTFIIGKGLLRPWKCMVVILGIIGGPLVRKKWCVVQAWDGKGKPHGCLEPTKQQWQSRRESHMSSRISRIIRD